jgi:exodeoxyribonuclease-3
MSGKNTMLRIISLNLNGIRSASSKGCFDWLAQQAADIVCVQELKAQVGDMNAAMINPPGYYGYFHYADKKGYSGVGIYCRRQPDQIIEGLGIADIDAEGRYIEVVFGKLSVVSVYLPSGSSGEERQAVKFSFMDRFWPHLEQLRLSGREVVICGDWNIAHREIDLKNWKGNLKNSGFLPEERAWLTRVFEEQGWVDVHRRLCPEATGEAYTWWSNRGQAWAKNVGWRIDYQIATPGIAALARGAAVYKAQRFSDHAPLIVEYDAAL